MTRKDKYASPCEAVSRANGLNGEFCVCNDLEEMKDRFPTVFVQRDEEANW